VSCPPATPMAVRPDDEFTHGEQRLLSLMRPLATVNLAAWLMMIPARPEMVLQVAKGDALVVRCRLRCSSLLFPSKNSPN
jgi:hypothetical protein